MQDQSIATMAAQQTSPKDAMPITLDDDKMSQAAVHLEKEDAYAADEAEHKLSMRKALRLYYKAVLWSATLSMALVMESYGNQPFRNHNFSSYNAHLLEKCCKSWPHSMPSLLSKRLSVFKFPAANINSRRNGKSRWLIRAKLASSSASL